MSVPANGSTSVLVSYQTLSVGDTGTIRLTATGINVSDAGSMHVVVGNSVGIDRPPLQNPAPIGPGLERNLCVSAGLIASAQFECGDLVLTHALPTARTLTQSRTPTLLYNSQTAHPYPLVAASLTLTSPLPNTVTAYLYINGGGTARGTGSWSGSEWSSAATRRIVVGYDAIGDTTGLYSYRLDIYKDLGSGPVLVRADTGHLVVVNRSASPFNPGWWLAGLERLIPQADGSLLYIGGDGSSRLYAAVPGRTDMWSAPQVDRRDWIKLISGQYSQFLRGGVRVQYSSTGQHLFTINRLNDTTSFTWTSGRLSAITVPRSAGATYAFTYGLSGSTLSSLAQLVGGVAQRATTISWDNGQVLRFVDPGNQSGKDVRFYYDPAFPQRITSRYNRNGDSVSFRYANGNKLVAAKAWMANPQDSIVLRFSPMEVLGLGNSVDTSQVYVTLINPRSESIATKIWVDRLGSPRKVQDALGQVSVLSRADARWPGLVTRDSAPNGQIIGVVYDSLGHPISVTDSSFVQGGQYATTRYEWDLAWDALTKAVRPLNDSVLTRYHSLTGNKLWVQPGSDFARRVKFAYGNSYKRLSSTQYPVRPGSPTLKDSLEYDGSLGNVSATMSTAGYWTVYAMDNLGRVTQVSTGIRIRVRNHQEVDLVVDCPGAMPPLPLAALAPWAGPRRAVYTPS